MKIIAINGSPRREGNTAKLLDMALTGAKAEGAETEMVQLYELNYMGCRSCFACRKKGGNSFGKCPVQDDLKPLLEKLSHADGIILGSPVYYASVTGAIKSFLERFCFPYMHYTKESSVIFNRQIPTGFIYTLNATEEEVANYGGAQVITLNNSFLQIMTGHCESFLSYNSYQFDDYSRYYTDGVDLEAKEKQRLEVFPKDMERAYAMGKRFSRGEVEYRAVGF